MLFEIKNLHVSVGGKEILKGIKNSEAPKIENICRNVKSVLIYLTNIDIAWGLKCYYKETEFS